MPDNVVAHETDDLFIEKTRSRRTAPTSKCISALTGTEVTVLCLENAEKIEYKGLLSHCSQNFDVQLSYCQKHPLIDKNDNITETKGSICREITLESKNIISITGTIENIDKLICRENEKGFATDAQISKERIRSVDTKEEDFQKWEPEGDLIEELEASNDSDTRVNGNHRGWSATEMFNANKKKFGVKTDFEEDLSQYTTVSATGTAEDIRRANEIAKRIENDSVSKHNAMLENDDEERSLDMKSRFDNPLSSGGSAYANNSGGNNNWRSQPHIGGGRTSGSDRDRRFRQSMGGGKSKELNSSSATVPTEEIRRANEISKRVENNEEEDRQRDTKPRNYGRDSGRTEKQIAPSLSNSTVANTNTWRSQPHGGTSVKTTMGSGTTAISGDRDRRYKQQQQSVSSVAANNKSSRELKSGTPTADVVDRISSPTTSSISGGTVVLLPPISSIPSTQSASAPAVTSSKDNNMIVDFPHVPSQSLQQQLQTSFQQPTQQQRTTTSTNVTTISAVTTMASKFKFNPDAVPFVPSSKKDNTIITSAAVASAVLSPAMTPINSNSSSVNSSHNNNGVSVGATAPGGAVLLMGPTSMPSTGIASGMAPQNVPMQFVPIQQFPPPGNIVYTTPAMVWRDPVTAGIPPQGIVSTVPPGGVIVQNSQAAAFQQQQLIHQHSQQHQQASQLIQQHNPQRQASLSQSQHLPTIQYNLQQQLPTPQPQQQQLAQQVYVSGTAPVAATALQYGHLDQQQRLAQQTQPQSYAQAQILTSVPGGTQFSTAAAPGYEMLPVYFKQFPPPGNNVYNTPIMWREPVSGMPPQSIVSSGGPPAIVSNSQQQSVVFQHQQLIQQQQAAVAAQQQSSHPQRQPTIHIQQQHAPQQLQQISAQPPIYVSTAAAIQQQYGQQQQLDQHQQPPPLQQVTQAQPYGQAPILTSVSGGGVMQPTQFSTASAAYEMM